MAVDNFHHAVDHLLVDLASGHFADGSEGHVVDEQDVEIGFSGRVRRLFLLLELLVDKAGQAALRVSKLADRIVLIKIAAPAAVRNRTAQKLSERLVRDLADPALCVSCKLSVVIRCGRIIAGSINAAFEADIRRRAPYADRVGTALDCPAVLLHVPIAASPRLLPGIPSQTL